MTARFIVVLVLGSLLVSGVVGQAPPVCCPRAPQAYCDFYFDGYENIVPTFRLNDGVHGDHPISPVSRKELGWVGSMDYFSPGVKAYKTEGFVGVYSTNINGTFLQCPDVLPKEVNPGDQFYMTSGYSTIGKLMARTWQKQTETQNGINWYADRCIYLPITGVNIPSEFGPINLNPGDDNLDYPEDRRCVVFRTAL